MWSAYRHFESNSGYVTAQSVINALKSNEIHCDEKGIVSCFEEFNKSGKKLNFEEFKKIVTI